MEVTSIAEQLLFTVVRIETNDASGNAGLGTGFIFIHNVGGVRYPFLVTNKHVVAGAVNGQVTFIQGDGGQPRLGAGHQLKIDDFARMWFGHPGEKIDVAIAPLAPLLEHMSKGGISIFFRGIENSLVPSDERLSKLDALEEVVFIGYPTGIWDRKNLLPVIRKGITATPVGVDFQGEKQFLIDASVFPGSSGSPVFLYNAGIHAEKGGGAVVGTRLLFLGIVASVFFHEEANEIQIMSVPTSHVPVAVFRQMVDLGVVYKASTILEAIDAFLRARGVLESPPDVGRPA